MHWRLVAILIQFFLEFQGKFVIGFLLSDLLAVKVRNTCSYYILGTLQTPTVGTEFVFGFMSNQYQSGSDVYILISNNNAASAVLFLYALDNSLIPTSAVFVPAQTTSKAS